MVLGDLLQQRIEASLVLAVALEESLEVGVERKHRRAIVIRVVVERRSPRLPPARSGVAEALGGARRSASGAAGTGAVAAMADDDAAPSAARPTS